MTYKVDIRLGRVFSKIQTFEFRTFDERAAFIKGVELAAGYVEARVMRIYTS